MKYYFVTDIKGMQHIIVAENEANARAIAEKSKRKIDCLYELNENTFTDEGYLMTAK